MLLEEDDVMAQRPTFALIREYISANPSPGSNHPDSSDGRRSGPAMQALLVVSCRSCATERSC